MEGDHPQIFDIDGQQTEIDRVQAMYGDWTYFTHPLRVVCDCSQEELDVLMQEMARFVVTG